MMALADGALFGYKTIDDVRNQVIPAGKNELVLKIKDEVLDLPILRRCTKAGGVTNEPMPQSAFLSIFRAMLKNAGYDCRASIHMIRRSLGKKVNGKGYAPPQLHDSKMSAKKLKQNVIPQWNLPSTSLKQTYGFSVIATLQTVPLLMARVRFSEKMLTTVTSNFSKDLNASMKMDCLLSFRLKGLRS